MAQSTRSYGGRSSSRGDSRSGGGRASGGRGGGGNSTGVIVAVAGLAVVIALVVIMTSKSKPKGPATPVNPPTPAGPTQPVKPKEPEMGPKPVLPAAMIEMAKGLIPVFEKASAEGKALHKQAMEAKDKGDSDEWQRLLEEARVVMKNGRDPWNELEGEVEEFLSRSPSKGWTTDLVMDAYFRIEGRKVKELLDEPLSSMVKTGHSR